MTGVTDERTSQSELEQVKERVQDVAGEAKQQTREQLRTQIDTRTSQAGEQISSTSQAFRGASDSLRQQGNDRAASVVETLAERSERFGTYLTRTDGDGLLRDAEDLARRQPWLIVERRRIRRVPGRALRQGVERCPLRERFVNAVPDERAALVRVELVGTDGGWFEWRPLTQPIAASSTISRSRNC